MPSHRPGRPGARAKTRPESAVVEQDASSGGFFDTLLERISALYDVFGSGIGEAVTDIRKKLEEAWFGREVTPRELIDPSRDREPAAGGYSFQELMAAQAALLGERDKPDTPEPDIAGPDR